MVIPKIWRDATQSMWPDRRHSWSHGLSAQFLPKSLPTLQRRELTVKLPPSVGAGRQGRAHMNKVAMHGCSNLQGGKRWGPGRAVSWIMFTFDMISDMVEAHYSSLAHAFQPPLEAVILDPSDARVHILGYLISLFASQWHHSQLHWIPPSVSSSLLSLSLWHEIPSRALILLSAAFVRPAHSLLPWGGTGAYSSRSLGRIGTSWG